MTLEVKHGELFTVLSREDMGTLAQLQSTIEGLYARIQDLKPWMEVSFSEPNAGRSNELTKQLGIQN